MMRIAALLFAILFASPLFADALQLVREGIALYDQGRYDEAIAKYNEALAEDPSSDLAAYELGLAYLAKKDTARCIEVLEPRAGRKNPHQASMYAILGNCHDVGGDSKRAIAAYRKGLKINPDEAQLLYNLAVTLAAKGEYDEARTLLKKELTVAPGHPSGHWFLAQIFDQQNFRVPAALSYLRFLSLQTSGARAKQAATRAVELLNAGIEVKDNGNVNITIDSKPRKEEGDYSAAEMMAAIAGGAALVPEENEKKSEYERVLGHVSSFLAMIAEGRERPKDYTASQVVPFFRQLYEGKHLEAFAAEAISSLGLAGGEEWRLAHAEAIDAYRRFLSGEK